MRPLTPFVSYLDNAGHPLVGRIRFCNPDASPAEVFAEDGTTSLGHSVFTDSSGRPVQQPFLEDHDYLLFFDKYVGHATMTEDDDTDSWEEQGSAKDRYDVFGVSVECGTVVSVANMESLGHTAPESVTPFGDLYMVDLLGYDTAGDKPVIRYVWDPECTDSDNGGSVVEVDGIETGRWVIKDRPEFVDSRHFGAFPNSTATAYPTQRYNLQRAALWAHDNGLGLYLHADDTHAYYDISGVNIYNLKCAPGATVLAVTGSVSNVIGVESMSAMSGTGIEGTVVITDRVVRTSWAGTSSHARLNPSELLVIDSRYYGVQGLRSWGNVSVEIYDSSNGDLNFEGCTVYVHVEMDSEKSASFERCTFVAAGTMDGYLHFTDCYIPSGLFTRDFDPSKCSLTDCVVAPASEWSDVGEWSSLKIENGDWEYDFCGKGDFAFVISKPSGSTGTLLISNSSNVVLKASGTIPKIELRDCVGTTIFTIPQDSKLVVQGGSVAGSMTLHDDVYFGHATVDGTFHVYASFGADDCVFTSNASVSSSYVRLSNCRADSGSVFAEMGTSIGFEGSLYENSFIGGSVSGYKSVVRNSHVARLTVLGLVAGSTSFPWESVIENSVVEDCRLQVTSTNKPAFTWKSSYINITQYGARYDVPDSLYTKEWSIDGCDVTFGSRKFYREKKYYMESLAEGALKNIMYSIANPQIYILCVPLDDLLVFENFYRLSSSTSHAVTGFAYRTRGMMDVSEGTQYDEQNVKSFKGYILNVDGVLCLGVDLMHGSQLPNTGDNLYIDFDVAF